MTGAEAVSRGPAERLAGCLPVQLSGISGLSQKSLPEGKGWREGSSTHPRLMCHVSLEDVEVAVTELELSEQQSLREQAWQGPG